MYRGVSRPHPVGFRLRLLPEFLHLFGKSEGGSGLDGHMPAPVLVAHKNQKQSAFGKGPSPKNLSRITLGIGKGVAPTRQVHKLDVLRLKGGDVPQELPAILGLQGLAVIVDGANLEGKEGLG
jgi:hypothetical protein